MGNKKFYYKNKKKSTKPAVDNTPITQYSAQQLGLTLQQLGLCDTTVELLSKNRINNASDLVKRNQKDMYKVQGLNKKIYLEVKNALISNGMDLRPDTPQPSQTQQVQDENKQDPQKSVKQNKDAKPQQKDAKQQNKEQKPQGNAQKAENKDGKQNGAGQKQQKQPKQAKQQVITEFDEEFWEDEANKSHSKFGLSDRKSQKPAPAKDGIAPGTWRKVMKGGKWGYSNGFKIVIPTVYDEIFAFKEGLASVEIDEKCGYIDESNTVVIPLDYETAMSFSEGLAMVVKDGKCGYINKNNEVIIPFEYDAATAFEDGEAKVKKDGKWGTLTPDNKVVWI